MMWDIVLGKKIPTLKESLREESGESEDSEEGIKGILGLWGKLGLLGFDQ